MKKRYLIYIIFVWVILMIPFAGMTFWPTTTTSENTELANGRSGKRMGHGIRITLKKRENTLRIISHSDNTL